MAFTALESRIFGGMFGSREAAELFSDEALVRLWCRVEVALAEAQAELGIVSETAVAEIARRMPGVAVDLDRLRLGTERVGYPILPLIELLEEALGPEAGGQLHWGATTQDIMDTAQALQMADLHDIVARDLGALSGALATLADRHRGLAMVGRTHGQHAVPITLGYKFAVWLSEVERHRRRWAEMRPRIAVGQLSGAGGTLASLGPEGLKVRQSMCQRLGLSTPPVTWHTARDGLAEMGSTLGLIAGTCGKLALEVATLQRNEIGELSEGFETGRGSSSTMPQKRNPITSEVMIAQSAFIRHQVPLLTYAMTGIHERATGEWQVEWIVFPELAVMSAGLLQNAISLLKNMVIDEAAIRRNLSLTGGLIVSERVMMALAPHVGRQEAHRIVYRASAEAINRGEPLIDALRSTPEIIGRFTEAELRELLDPAGYTGNAEAFVDAALEELAQGVGEGS